jgi:hypothetical protein
VLWRERITEPCLGIGASQKRVRYGWRWAYAQDEVLAIEHLSAAIGYPSWNDQDAHLRFMLWTNLENWTWMPFFKGWALYCQSPPSTTLDWRKLPPLSSKLYLHHYNELNKLYENELLKDTSTDERHFRGAAVLVGLERNTLVPLANALKDKLLCFKMLAKSNDLSQNGMMGSVQSVCLRD